MSTILVVDDHPFIRQLIRLTIGGAHEVLEADDGISALRVARERRPDVVVLDVMMPGGMDGLEVLDAIRADPELASTPVIMLTARGQARDYEEGMARGADAYFIKPFSPLQLLNAIREHLK